MDADCWRKAEFRFWLKHTATVHLLVLYSLSQTQTGNMFIFLDEHLDKNILGNMLCFLQDYDQRYYYNIASICCGNLNYQVSLLFRVVGQLPTIWCRLKHLWSCGSSFCTHTDTQLLVNWDTSESCQEAANAALRRLRQSIACWECLSDRSIAGCHSGSGSESHYRRTTMKIEQYTYCLLTMPSIDWADDVFASCHLMNVIEERLVWLLHPSKWLTLPTLRKERRRSFVRVWRKNVARGQTDVAGKSKCYWCVAFSLIPRWSMQL